MRGRFTRFVLELCKSKKKVREFERDPDRLIRLAGLTAEEAEALKSRNSSEINELIEQECGVVAEGGVKHVETGVKHVETGVKYVPPGVKKVEIIPERWIAKPSKQKSQKATRGKKAGKSRTSKTKRT